VPAHAPVAPIKPNATAPIVIATRDKNPLIDSLATTVRLMPITSPLQKSKDKSIAIYIENGFAANGSIYTPISTLQKKRSRAESWHSPYFHSITR
jgi:hypothetical protein